MQPTAFILCLPLGDSELITNHALENASGDEVGRSAISMYVRPDARRGFSVVPFASFLDLGNRFPQLRALRLRCIVMKPDVSQGALASFPRFALLETLTILPGYVHISGEAPITTSLLLLFPHTPHLRSLTVYAGLALPHYEPERDQPYPDPTFSLKRLVCLGGLSIAACAQIITHSTRTLVELTINIGMSGVEADEARLVTAIAQAGPRLRILDIRLLGKDDLWPRVAPVFAALARVETLRLEAPLDALVLLDGGCTPLRELDLQCRRYPHVRTSAPASQLSLYLLRTPLLRTVTLRGFDVGDEELDALLEHSRARRIRCRITHY